VTEEQEQGNREAIARATGYGALFAVSMVAADRLNAAIGDRLTPPWISSLSTADRLSVAVLLGWSSGVVTASIVQWRVRKMLEGLFGGPAQ